jgi:hypothetical protein
MSAVKKFNWALWTSVEGKRRAREDYVKEVIFELKNEKQPTVGMAEWQRVFWAR